MCGNENNENVSLEDGYSRSDMVFKGPMHELIFMTKEGKLMELYFKHGEKLIYHFVTKILSNVIGKRKWNNMSCKKLMNVFVTNSDEAFAMLVMENNCLKWEDEYENPGMDRRMKMKTRWTETEDGSRSWSIEGMRRYMELYKGLDNDKEEHKGRYYEIMDIVRTMEIEKHNGSSKRKKRELMRNEEAVDISNNQNDELEQFLM